MKKKINQWACYNRIWSWSAMPFEKHGPRASVTTKTSAFGLGFCLLSPSGHVFHTAWETMIKSYTNNWIKAHVGDVIIVWRTTHTNTKSNADRFSVTLTDTDVNILGIRVKYNTYGNSNIPATESRLWGTRWYYLFSAPVHMLRRGAFGNFPQRISIERSRTAPPGAVLQRANIRRSEKYDVQRKMFWVWHNYSRVYKKG